MAESEQVLQKKNEKHSHTDGSLRKAMGCSCTAAAPPLAAAGWLDQEPLRSSSDSRLITMIIRMTKASAAPLRQAVRHEPVAVAMPAMNTGAVAQPRLPEMPCTAKPWPRRLADTRLLRMVKSTGWNGALPMPASNEARISDA